MPKINQLLTGLILSIAVALPVATWANQVETNIKPQAKLDQTNQTKLIKSKSTQSTIKSIKANIATNTVTKNGNGIKLKSDYPARDNFNQEVYQLMIDTLHGGNPYHAIPPEDFVFFRFAEQGFWNSSHCILEGCWLSGSRAAKHTDSTYKSAHFIDKNKCFNITDQAKANSIIIDGDGWPRWVLEVIPAEDEYGKYNKLFVEWVDLDMKYHKDWMDDKGIHCNRKNGGRRCYLSPKTLEDEEITTDKGYIPYRGPIFEGYPDGTIRPFNLVTRAEFLKTLAKVLQIEAKTDLKDQFNDINNHWAKDIINTMAEYKFVRGRGNGKFDPNGYITNVEMLKIVTNVWDRFGYNYVNNDNIKQFKLVDVDGIQGYDPNDPRAYPKYRGFDLLEYNQWNLDRAGIRRHETKLAKPRQNWMLNPIIATMPLYIDNLQLLGVNKVEYDKNGFVQDVKINWDQPVKRYQVAFLFNVLTARYGGHGDGFNYEQKHFTDLTGAAEKSNINLPNIEKHIFDMRPVDPYLSAKDIMTIATFDTSKIDYRGLDFGKKEQLEAYMVVREYIKNHQ